MDMEQNGNDENTICARIEKVLMDAADAADETITAAVDEKDPVRRMAVLMDGYRRAVKALLPNEDLERLHLSEKCGMDLGHGPSETAFSQIVPVSIPGGSDGTFPGHDPAEEVARKESALDVLRDKFGLDMTRFATGKAVKYVGKRRTKGGLNDSIWEIDLDKAFRSVEVRCDGAVVFRMRGFFSSSVVEKMTVSALIRLLSERRRRHLCGKRARIRARAAKEAARE